MQIDGKSIAVAGPRYVIGMLFVTYALNYLDRQIVNILAEPIKRDLQLADWQLGVISGFAFALLYTLLGIPLARWADRPRNDRVTLIALSLSVWSGMTMICAGATSFVQMTLARIGVGVGEAGCSPAAHSLISDVVPAERRATALGIYSLGVPVGKLAGMVAGGWIAQHYGWRAAFLVVGTPGILLAILVRLTITDPRRSRPVNGDARGVSLGEAWGRLRTSNLFWLATLACSMTSFLSLGGIAFLGSFLIRVHGLSIGQVGLWLGLAIGVGGSVGAWLGGVTCDRLGRRDARLYMVLPGLASLAGGALIAAAALAGSADAALALLALSAVMTSFWYGPVFSAVQSVAAPQYRATAAAIHLFVVNAIGFGLGPVTIGLLSDGFATGAFGGSALGPAEGLRWALVAATAITVLAAALFLRAASFVQAQGK